MTTSLLHVQIEKIEWMAWSNTLICWGTNLFALVTCHLCSVQVKFVIDDGLLSNCVDVVFL